MMIDDLVMIIIIMYYLSERWIEEYPIMKYRTIDTVISRISEHFVKHVQEISLSTVLVQKLPNRSV